MRPLALSLGVGTGSWTMGTGAPAIGIGADPQSLRPGAAKQAPRFAGDGYMAQAAASRDEPEQDAGPKPSLACACTMATARWTSVATARVAKATTTRNACIVDLTLGGSNGEHHRLARSTTFVRVEVCRRRIWPYTQAFPSAMAATCAPPRRDIRAMDGPLADPVT